MCGIAGIIHRDGPTDIGSETTRMLQSAHGLIGLSGIFHLRAHCPKDYPKTKTLAMVVGKARTISNASATAGLVHLRANPIVIFSDCMHWTRNSM